MNKYFNLPDGGSTRKVKEYVAAWKFLAAPLEEVSGLKLSGFDPGFLLVDIKNSRVSWDCPVWLAKKICAALNEYYRAGKTVGRRGGIEAMQDEIVPGLDEEDARWVIGRAARLLEEKS